MGRYVDWGDVVARYKTVATDATSPELQEGWIAGAEDALDAALAARYTVPFTAPVPGLVADIVIDLVYFKMTVRQPESKLLKEYIDERIRGIVDGTLTLGPDLSQGGFSKAQAAGRLSSFGPDRPENWRIDPDWIEDARNERT